MEAAERAEEEAAAEAAAAEHAEAEEILHEVEATEDEARRRHRGRSRGSRSLRDDGTRADFVTTLPQAHCVLWNLRRTSRSERAFRPQLCPVTLATWPSFSLLSAGFAMSKTPLSTTTQAPSGVLDSPAVAQVAQLSSAAPVPPQNLDAEESVLGAMMLSPGAIGAVSEILDAGDFYRESHGKIYRAGLALYAQGEPVDAITLVDELEERGELEDVGGRVRIHELAALVPAAANAGALRPDRPRDGDAPRADSHGPGDRTARLGAPGRDRRARRPGGAGGVRALAGPRHDGVRAHRPAAQGELRADHAAVRGRRRRDRHAVRLPRPRPAHLRVPARKPDHRRRPPVDGKVRARALHGREPRRARRDARSGSSRSRCRSPRSRSG